MIKLANEAQKWDILKNAKNLKNATGWMARVGISQDMSKEGREKHKELRKSLKDKRDKGENDWFIRNGKLQKKNY